MKQDVTESMYMDAFRNYDRYDNFSYYGHIALYEYLTELGDDCENEMELDVIAICCDFTEYRNLQEIQENYTYIKDMDDLYDHTQVIEFSENNEFMTGPTSGIIIQDF